MPIPPFGDPKPGQRLAASDISRLYREVERQGNVGVAQGMNVLQHAGGTFFSPNHPPRVAMVRVTGLTSGNSSGAGSGQSGGFGGALWPAMVTFYVDHTGTWTDEVECWLIEPNNSLLGEQYFEAFLVGAANGRLVFATALDQGEGQTSGGIGPGNINLVAKVCPNFIPSDAGVWEYWRGVGRWHFPGVNSTGGGNATSIFAVKTHFALPFVSTRPCLLDQIGVWMQTGAGGSVARLGIYDTDLCNITNFPYPGTLVLDAGEVDFSSGTNTIKFLEINQELKEETLYWLDIIGGGGFVTTLLRILPAIACFPALGFASDFNFLDGGYGRAVAVASYPTSLPTTFPAGAGIVGATTKLPAVGVRYAG